jgi:magnesium transporter
MPRRKKINKKVFIALIAARKVSEIRALFEFYNIIDLATLCEDLNLEALLMLFKVLRKDIGAELFTYLSFNKQQEVIEAFSGPEIKRMLENLYSDDIVEFIDELPSNLATKILRHASEDQRADINLLLSYPEDSAGSMMTVDFVELKRTDSVKRAINRVKQQGRVAETITNCYIVDENRSLVGSIRLRDILFAEEDEIIEDLMETDVIALLTSDDQEQVANTFKKYDYNVLPVVNNEFKLMGVITVDDVLDVMYEETTEDMQKIAAIQPTDGSYKETNILEMTKSRIVWLVVLMVSATFTGFILQGYEEALTYIPALAISLPMIMSTAGNAGSQASIMVIREIALEEVKLTDLWKVMVKELKIALVIGLILFVINVLRLMIFNPENSIQVDLVISLTIFVTVLLAKATGGLLPLLALAIKQDPAAMASPLITTIVDALALLVYFNLAIRFIPI